MRIQNRNGQMIDRFFSMIDQKQNSIDQKIFLIDQFLKNSTFLIDQNNCFIDQKKMIDRKILFFYDRSKTKFDRSKKFLIDQKIVLIDSETKKAPKLNFWGKFCRQKSLLKFWPMGGQKKV